MTWKGFLSALVVPTVLSANVQAQEPRYFAGLNLLAGAAFGSSHTTNGGAPFANGSIVHNVEFGETVGIGGHLGYRVDSALSVFVSYQHISGDVGWYADFPLVGVSSQYEGTATSNAVLANAAYDLPLSDATILKASAGLGVAFNTLSELFETDRSTGEFLSHVEDHTEISPMAQIGAGIRYEIAPNMLLGLDALFAYAGSFETGNTRRGNLGITEIRPFRIDDVWRANLGASVTIAF